MEGDEWDSLVATSRRDLEMRQAALFADLDASIHWHYDLDEAVIEFSRAGELVAKTPIVVAGTTSEAEGTWLWSWANEPLPEASTRGIERVRAFGEEHGFEGLTRSEWTAQEPYVGDVVAVAASVLESIGYFRTVGRDVPRRCPPSATTRTPC